MAQDDYNFNEDDPNQPYQPSQQEWDKASNLLNSYKDKDGGGDINWEKARSVFNEQAAQGGNFGDWVNKTYSAKDSWLNKPLSQPQPQQQPQAASGSWDREAFKNATMGRASGQSVADFLAANPQLAQGVRFVPGSKDKVILPTGEVMDLSINADANGAGTPGWTGAGYWDGSQIQQYAPDGSGGGAGAGGSYGSTVQTSSAGGMNDPLRAQLVDMLLKRAQQGTTIDQNDPNIRQQTDAYAADAERARRNYLADQAEKQGPLSNLQGEERLTAEQLGQQTGTFRAQLIGREIQARRDEIAQALQSMQGLITAEQEMSLRKELATMDDALKRLQLDQSGQQFNAQLGERANEFGATTALDQQQFIAGLLDRGIDPASVFGYLG